MCFPLYYRVSSLSSSAITRAGGYNQEAFNENGKQLIIMLEDAKESLERIRQGLRAKGESL